MRPIEKHPPLDEQGLPKQYSAYQNAREDLIRHLGHYCSYCGAQLDASLAVEHVRPKDTNPELALQWENFLLACTNCNSTKGSKPIVLQDYYWPDQDNTHGVFQYGEGGTIALHPDLEAAQQVIAQQTLTLTGLDKKPGHQPTLSDRRWMNRKKAWDLAEQAKDLIARQDTPELRAYVVESATHAGFWSVWIAVFQSDQEMLEALINAFPGTWRAFQQSGVRPRS